MRLPRDAGAREVHLRLSSPPIRYPCFTGSTSPRGRSSISNRLEADGIAREIEADSVRFLSLEALREMRDDARELLSCLFQRCVPWRGPGRPREQEELSETTSREAGERRVPK